MSNICSPSDPSQALLLAFLSCLGLKFPAFENRCANLRIVCPLLSQARSIGSCCDSNPRSRIMHARPAIPSRTPFNLSCSAAFCARCRASVFPMDIQWFRTVSVLAFSASYLARCENVKQDRLISTPIELRILQYFHFRSFSSKSSSVRQLLHRAVSPNLLSRFCFSKAI